MRRGLQALSSLYVERRQRLGAGAALDGAGKRAAFALYYGPLHFLLVREVVRALGAAAPPPARIVDLGCGTGMAGAAWALEAGGRPAIDGVDQNGWAVAEARWTLARLGLEARVRRGELSAAAGAGSNAAARTAVVAAFAANELPDASRAALWTRLRAGAAEGWRVLVVEPLARRAAPWWEAWSREAVADGGRADEWRFQAALPEEVTRLGRAAGLDPRDLSGRSLYLGGRR